MSRFQMEITGKLGEFWKNRAEAEVEAAVAKAEEYADVDENGVIRWKSNGRCLMDDFCEMLEYAGYDFSRMATAQVRAVDNAEFCEHYRAYKKEPTEEELNEMRATFAPGTTVVDVISGRVYRV